MKTYQYLFGPVPSRRLGASLGIDLLPRKTCSLNCVYCECGETDKLTLERREYVPTAAVLAELDDFFAGGVQTDFVTFSGSGEPTLHSGIGEVARHVKSCGRRVCLLTNATLLGDERLIDELRVLDLIVPSLDATTPAAFAKINLPPPGLACEDIIDNIAKFRRLAPEVAMWLEIFMVPGVNDDPESLAGFAKAVCRISPDKVQLNSLDRPAWVDWLTVPEVGETAEFAAAIPAEIPVEVVGGGARRRPSSNLVHATRGKVLELLSRRPMSLEDILHSFPTVDPAAIRAGVDNLVAEGELLVEPGTRGDFYRSKGNPEKS